MEPTPPKTTPIESTYAERIIRESANALAMSIEKTIYNHSIDIKKALETIIKEDRKSTSQEIKEIKNYVYWMYGVRAPEDCMVYAYHLVPLSNPLMDDMLVVVVSTIGWDDADKQRDQQIKDTGREPSQWKVKLQTSIRLYIKPRAEIPVIRSKYGQNTVSDTLEEGIKKTPALPMDTYISNLMYARDKFAETAYEKGLITKIINRVQNKTKT